MIRMLWAGGWMALGMALAGCDDKEESPGGEGSGGEEGGEEEEQDPTSCDLELTIRFNDETNARVSGCASVDADVEYEFDPDASPEIRSMDVTLDAVDEEGFECSLRLSFSGICGEGDYSIAPVDVFVLNTADCEGIEDEFEGEYDLSATYFGTLSLTALDAGTEAGNFSGEPLLTTIEAGLEIETNNDNALVQSVSGTLSFTEEISAEDAEQGECNGPM